MPHVRDSGSHRLEGETQVADLRTVVIAPEAFGNVTQLVTEEWRLIHPLPPRFCGLDDCIECYALLGRVGGT